MMTNENNTEVNNTPEVEQTNSQPIQNQQIARVSAKLPPLWKNNIQIWFIQVEVNFELAGIVNDATKYNHVVAAIDPNTLSAVSDILISPPKTNKYETLKKRLVKEFSQSETHKIRQLVSELQLGDDKPSYLFRKMKELAGTAFTDNNFLKTLWLQRLPAEVQAILSVSTETVDNLVNLADKILEVRSDTTGNAVAATSQTIEGRNPHAEEVSALRCEIAELTKQVQRLARPQERGYRERPFHRSPNRNYRRNSHSRERRDYGGMCYYHFKFGDRAFGCKQPCNYRSGPNQSAALPEN